MKYIFNKSILLVCIVLAASSCKKNFDNPNAALSQDVFTNSKAMMGAAIGLHRTYSISLADQLVRINAITTNEAIVVNVGNVSEALLAGGGNLVDGNNGLLGSFWINNSKVVFDADNIINAASRIGDLNYQSGLIAYTTIFKALAYGNLCMFWEQVPDSVGSPVTAPTRFITRTQGFTKIIASIDRALALIAANPPSATVLSEMAAGINIVNSLNALKARYSLYTGNFAAALTAATAVSTTVTSTFNFDALNGNPIFLNVTATNNVYQPTDGNLGLPTGIQPATADARVQFYTVTAASAPLFRMRGFFTAATQAIPVYLNDEMRLIRAECLLRQSTPDAAAAKLLIDQVLQQTPAADLNGVGANIAAGYTGTVDVPSLLTEVYRNRCIELFMSGLKLEDMRRFGRANTERKRNFFPYPFRERDGNTNTPADPAF
jgi:starch-binding outer membrane protein, SusD/RagB family